MNQLLTRENEKKENKTEVFKTGFYTQPITKSVSDKAEKYTELLKTADNNTKNIIENELVNIGRAAVPSLVKALHAASGRTRGVIAMALIRIGTASIDYLKRAAASDKNFKWAADYIISEIQSTAA